MPVKRLEKEFTGPEGTSRIGSHLMAKCRAEYDGDTFSLLPDGSDEVDSVEVGHGHICDHQVEIVWVFVKHVQRIFRTRTSGYPETTIFEGLLPESHEGFFIIDKKNVTFSGGEAGSRH